MIQKIINFILQMVIDLLQKGNQKGGLEAQPVSEPEPTVFITAQDILSSSGTYPKRLQSPELTDEVRANAEKLATQVNKLLNLIGWKEKIIVTSGFRPSAVNSQIANAAKKSAHQIGLAVDIFDEKDQRLGYLIRQKQNNDGVKGILGQCGLMMEHLDSTRGSYTNWVHLDMKPRTERASMEFKP